jgi:hypothetical protein
MFSKDFIAYFKLAHGFFNAGTAVLFFYQGWLGLAIRRARKSGAPLPLVAVRRHRRAGPVFALWGMLGYLAGILLVLLDKGRLLEYPTHFSAGTAIAVLIGLSYAASRGIRGPAEGARDRHFILGAALLGLYVVQTLLGLSILF